MIAIYLFLTSIYQDKVSESNSLSIWDINLSENLYLKTNFSIENKEIKVPCALIPSDRYQEIQLIVPYRYKIDLHGYLKKQIYDFFYQFIPSDIYKVETILSQLEKYNPNEIEYFKRINSHTQRAEKLSEIINYLPFSDHYNIFQYNPSDYRYAYTYQYSPLFESYHQFFECSQTGRSFFVRGNRMENEQILVTKVSNSCEQPLDVFFRTFENLKYILNNFEEIAFKYDDPYKVLNSNYNEFLSSCKKIAQTDVGNREFVLNVKSEVSKAVIDFISHSNDTVYNTVNIFNVNVPVLLVSSTNQKNGASRVECFYMNEKQSSLALHQLNDEYSLFEIVRTFFHSIYMMLLFWLLKSCSIRNFTAFLAVSGSLLTEMKRDGLFYNPFVDWIGNKINSLVTSPPDSHARRDEDLMNMRRQESAYREGREMVKQLIKNAIKGHCEPFILKIEKSNQADYKVDSLLMFPRV